MAHPYCRFARSASAIAVSPGDPLAADVPKVVARAQAHAPGRPPPPAVDRAAMHPGTLRLPQRLETQLLLGHPWVYRDQVPRGVSAQSGEFLKIECGKFEAWALWDPSSALALRIYSREQRPNAAWFEGRLAEAWQLRAPVREGRTSAFRWVFGEADGLPGLVVDYYAGFAVVVCDTDALLPHLGTLLPALRSVGALRSVVLRQRGASADSRLELLWGDAPPAKLLVEENGLALVVDLAAGQKTGLFLDHRDNRACVERIAAGKRVLNLFAYTGGFSLAALRGGARQVVSVDAAPEAAVDAQRNLEENQLDVAKHRFVVADVFEYLEHARQGAERFDLVISDPPSFARSNQHLDKALGAYARVHAAAMKVTEPGGLLAAASCTGRVSPEAFKSTLAQAARRARLRCQIIAEAGQPIDHPVLAAHPEGRYLKFVLARLLERA